MVLILITGVAVVQDLMVGAAIVIIFSIIEFIDCDIAVRVFRKIIKVWACMWILVPLVLDFDLAL